MLSSSWLISGRESQGERCVGNPPPQGVLGPRIGTRGLMPFGETTKMHNLEPFCVGTHILVLLKSKQRNPWLKKSPHLYDLEVVKLLCSRGKTFIKFLLCADVFVFVKAEPPSSPFSAAVKRVPLFGFMRLCLPWKAVWRSGKWLPADKLGLTDFPDLLYFARTFCKILSVGYSIRCTSNLWSTLKGKGIANGCVCSCSLLL